MCVHIADPPLCETSLYLPSLGTVSRGARLYIPVSRYALQSLNLPLGERDQADIHIYIYTSPFFFSSLSLGRGLAADCPILKNFYLPSIDWSHVEHVCVCTLLLLLYHTHTHTLQPLLAYLSAYTWYLEAI